LKNFSVHAGQTADRRRCEELPERMFAFHPSVSVEPILDATYNAGRSWKGSARHVVSMYMDPRHTPEIVGDDRVMDGVASGSFATVVCGPPHVGPQVRDRSRKRFDVDFGAMMVCGEEQGWSPSHLHPPFLAQARRVLKPKGLLLTRITDMVNCHRSQWAHCDFMRMADEVGFTVCDLIVKVRKGPMMSKKPANMCMSTEVPMMASPTTMPRLG